MKTILDPKKLPPVIFLLGLGGLGVQLLIRLLATDSRGLIVAGHPLIPVLWLLGAAALAVIWAGVRPLGGSSRYAANFPASGRAALGCAAMAAGTLISTALGWEHTGLGLWHYILGLGAGCCMIFLTYARYRGIRPNFLMHTLVCIFLAIHMVSRYRVWSGNPQLMEYIFEVFGCVGLMFFAYQQAAFAVGLGKRRTLLATGLLTAFCAMAAVPAAADPLLYAGGALWTLTDLCTLTPPPRRKKAAPEAPRDCDHETA